MRLRVVIVCCSRPRTSTARPCSGWPAVSSTTRGEARLAARRRPARHAQAGHHRGSATARTRWATVCTSPFGSLKLSSASSSDGPRERRQVLHHHGRRALRVGHGRQLVGDQPAGVAASRSSASSLPSRHRRARRREAEVLDSRQRSARPAAAAPTAAAAPPPAGPPDKALSCAWQATSLGATGTARRRRQPRVDQRHAEGLDAEAAAGPAARRRGVSATSYRPSAAVVGIAQRLSARVRAVRPRRPGQRQHDLVAAAHVGEHHFVGQRCRRRAAPGRARSRRARSASSTPSRRRAAACGRTPCGRGGRASVPPAVGRLKRQGSMPRFQWLKTKDRSSPSRAVTKWPSRLRQRSPKSSSKPRSMRAMPCASVLPLHSGRPRQSLTATRAPATGPAAVQRGHPDQAGRAPALEVHAQVGDQHAGAHVHRCLPGQQRVAEDARLDLHHVVAALRQRDADHLGGARLAALQLRQLGALHAGFLRQQRGLARLEGRLVRPPAGAPASAAALRRSSAASSRLMATRPPVAAPARSACTWRSVSGSMASGPASTMPKPPPGKLGQRRQAARGHRQRKRRRVGQRAAGVVAQVGRQREREARVLRQRRGKAQFLDPFVVAGRQRPQRLALRRLQPRGQRRRARHRRVELQHQRPQRQAGRLRVLALAAELGQETRPHLPLEALLAARDELRLARRGHARAPHQAHAGLRPGTAAGRPAAARGAGRRRASAGAATPRAPRLAPAPPAAVRPGLPPRTTPRAARWRRRPRRSGAAGNAGLRRCANPDTAAPTRPPARRWRSRRRWRPAARRPAAGTQGSAAACSGCRRPAPRASRRPSCGRWSSGRRPAAWRRCTAA